MIDTDTKRQFEAAQEQVNTDHIRVDGRRMFCTHCGHQREIRLPVSIPEFARISEAYIQRHLQCKPKSV